MFCQNIDLFEKSFFPKQYKSNFCWFNFTVQEREQNMLKKVSYVGLAARKVGIGPKCLDFFSDSVNMLHEYDI